MTAYTLPLPPQVTRTLDRLGHHWFWFRVFWALGVLGFAVGLILVADPAPAGF